VILLQNYFYNDNIGKLKHKAHLPEKADIVIVGGGIVGLATLYSLLQKKLDAILLDSGSIGFRASGRSLGASTLPSLKYLNNNDFIKNNSLLESVIKAPTVIDCQHSNCGEIILSTTEFKDINYDVLSKTDINNLYKVNNYKYGLFVPNSISFNPFRLMTHLIILCESYGSHIFEGISTLHYEEKDNKILIDTDGDQKIECKKLIICDPFYYKFLKPKYDLQHKLIACSCTNVLSNNIFEDLPHYIINLYNLGAYLKIHDNRIFITTTNLNEWEKVKKIVCRLFKIDNMITTYYWYGRIFYVPNQYYILENISPNIIVNTAYNNHAFSLCFDNAEKITASLIEDQKLGG